MKNIHLSVYILSFTVLFLPVAVEAHPFHWVTQSIGFTSGFFHQLTDVDHILLLLMIGVGFSKPSINAQAVLLILFVMLMLAGAGLSLVSFDMSGIHNIEEIKTLSSLLVLGLGGKVLRLPKGMLIVGALALFHGYTHAYDMLLDADANSFTLGYVTSTAVLILSGIILRAWINRHLLSAHYFEQYG